LAWAPFGLPPKFVPLAKLSCLIYDIKIFGIPFSYASFAFFFFWLEALGEDVGHLNVILKLEDV
jgi:hypothetical protein